MASPSPLARRVLGEVKRLQSCDLDTLRQNLSDFSWSQVFMEIDRLSRSGQVLVTFGTGGNYTVRVPEKKARATDTRS